MNLEIRLFAYFRDGRGKKCFMEFKDNERITPMVILEKLDIPLKDVALLLVNGIDVLVKGDIGAVETILKDGDIIALFPPVGGG